MSDFIVHTGELYHYGVKGMKWGKRKKHYGYGTGIVADKPRGTQSSWQHKKTDSQKRWIDNHGINPHRPYDTSNNKNVRKKLEKEYGNLENQMTYGKKADPKKNAKIQKKITEIENKINQLSKQERDARIKKAKTFMYKISKGDLTTKR